MRRNMHHLSIILNAIYDMWIERSIYFVRKKESVKLSCVNLYVAKHY